MKSSESNHATKNVIFKTLLKIKAVSRENIEVLSNHTRDKSNLNVYTDKKTGVIFIDTFFIGESEYIEGRYRRINLAGHIQAGAKYEDERDSTRRLDAYQQFIGGKSICDFGCGAGTFLKKAKAIASDVLGVELQADYREQLNSLGVPCDSGLQMANESLDSITLFHCLEHLPDPTETLVKLRKKLKPNGEGVIIIEVPHARDFLIENLKLQEFIEFTLWSQHLVLHTRESLRLLLDDAGYKNIIIQGVQRFGLSNHLHWLSAKKPQGHRSVTSVLETPELQLAYQNALSKIDATDTLTLIATT
jgi:2-polyprenyl-3-methyl-5-hydroxy-6-metoxy-1,4-benzoquinol methylase